MSQGRHLAARCLLVVALIMVMPVPGARAQTPTATQNYRIGVGDVLRLNVPGDQRIERDLTVQPDGTVSVPQIGAVAIGGLSIKDAQELLRQRLRLYNPNVDAVNLVVTQYNALRVFVLGAVTSPGAYPFTAPPTVWEALRAAGGPVQGANLSVARIIATRDGEPSFRTVNLSGYLSGETMPSVVLETGDTLVIPAIADGTVGVAANQGVQVFGGVTQPTTVPIDEPLPLLSVLMLAGAPMSDAVLNKIDWVHGEGESGRRLRAKRVDMTQYLEHGRPEGNPLIYPGDTVYLPQRHPNWFANNLPLILTTLSTAATIYLVYDRAQNSSN